MTTKKPSHEEEEYFAKEETARMHALAVDRARRMEQEELARLKAAHFMKCPKCGFDLETVGFKGLKIDRCFHCGGTWLDQGELETLAGHEHDDILHRIVALFRPEKK
jgi:hypothetical protein